MNLRSFDEPDPQTIAPVELPGEPLGVKPKLPVYRLVIHLPEAAASTSGGTLPPGGDRRSDPARTLGADSNARP